ncbi:cofilin [Coemansia sp. RSA 988]|nr:cofilin [Coemansia sp. RSA 988]
MSSGIKVNPECFTVFDELKKGRKFKFVIFKISDDFKEVVVDNTSQDNLKDAEGKDIPQKEDSFEEFILRLPKNSGRFAVFDYTKEPAIYNKLLFYVWAPDNAPIKSKMLYASTKSTLRAELSGISADIQATDGDELTQEAILEKLKTYKYY